MTQSTQMERLGGGVTNNPHLLICVHLRPKLPEAGAGGRGVPARLGAQGERYLLEERVSVFVGLGYTPQLDPGDPTGPTFAVGLRSFTSGLKHRLFVETSASQVVVVTGGGQEGTRHYGPGLQTGYQFVSPGGFTLMASVGAGYALGVPRGLDPWATQVGLGVGYTWRRSHAGGERRRM